jgi:hypothetical protein
LAWIGSIGCVMTSKKSMRKSNLVSNVSSLVNDATRNAIHQMGKRAWL